MKEKDLQQKIRKALKKEFGGVWNKNHGSGMQSTLLDLTGCVDGWHIEIEVKMPGRERTLSERQQKRIDDINEAGGIAFMSSSVEHCIETLEDQIYVGD